MKILLLSLTFILTTSVMARASEPRWVTNYSSETEVNGLPVRANLDVKQMDGETPLVSVNFGDTHSLLPVMPNEYRLNLIVSESPRVQLTYKVQPRTILVNGSPRFAYVSETDQNIRFLITTEKSGSLHVSYSQSDASGEANVGEFSMIPVPHIL
jgi:hypothetical protein